ncbi:MAG: NADH-quinone oxidoreductase subunit M [Bacteroidia bacterium]|nr:NADH-quinone oxidoreductase subunit M [Bacteroidia bacterium]
MNLSLLVMIPLVTFLAILVARGGTAARLMALSGSVVQLALSVALLFLYLAERDAGNNAAVLFETDLVWFSNWNIHYHTGVDGIAVAMILLTSFVMLAGVLVSWNIPSMKKEFFALLIFLGTGAYGFFISIDLFTMFFFFELAVIPKYLLIAIWGSGKKEYASMKLALMLMAGSSLVLAGLLLLNHHTQSLVAGGTFNLLQIAGLGVSEDMQMILFPMIFTGFAVLSAMFPFHSWAPDGHSSAPTAASMFLAGISMKLGGYGCLRVAMWMFPEAARAYADWIIVLAVIGILYGAFVTLYQKDIKLMNAYSSVSHCGFVLLGLGMMTVTSSTGAVLQMISHGVMTALFFGVIGMVYERTHTRMSYEMGGLLKVMPFIGTVFFIAGLTSLGLPGFSGFVAEMTVFVGSFEVPGMFYRICTLLGCMSIVVTAVYILRATGMVMMGPVRHEEHRSLPDATWNEKAAAALLVICIVVMGTMPWWLSDMVRESTKVILESAAVIQP